MNAVAVSHVSLFKQGAQKIKTTNLQLSMKNLA